VWRVTSCCVRRGTTLSNLRRLGAWSLQVPLNVTVKAVRSSANANMFMFEKSCDKELWSTIKDLNPTFKPSLIFCSSRKGTESAAKVVLADSDYRPSGPSSLRLKAVAAQLGSVGLGQLVSRGVAYHHAGYVLSSTAPSDLHFPSNALDIVYSL
jgi:replicative superfamily II helicase